MIDTRTLSRRDFVKGAAVLAAALPLGGLLAGCSAQEDPAPADGAEGRPATDDADAAPAAETSEPAQEPAANAVGGAALVAYFSATGTTERVAAMIADHTGADLFALEPVEPYTDADLNYNGASSRTSTERVDPNRSVALARATPDGFANYDVVYLGYPIWWGDASWVVDQFVTANDFTGKTVVPFCTSGSSPIGRSGENLATLAGTGTWVAGHRFGGSASAEDVTSWVDGLVL